MASPAGRSLPIASRRKGASSPTAPTPSGRKTLIPAARDADLFICEAYYYDRIVKNHLSLKTLEQHLPRIAPKTAGAHPHERRHAGAPGLAALHGGKRRDDHRAVMLQVPPDKSTTAPAARPTHTRDVFAIAGPAMLANLTTPLLGVVATAAIGRLGDAALLGGVAMATVIFDCLFWLFGFLRMGTVAFTAQAQGARRPARVSAAAAARSPARRRDRNAAHRLAGAACERSVRRDGRQRRRDARRASLLRRSHLVRAAGVRQLRDPRLAGRTGARRTCPGHSGDHQYRRHGADGGAGARAGLGHRGRGRCVHRRGGLRPHPRSRDRPAASGRAVRACRLRRCSTVPNSCT